MNVLDEMAMEYIGFEPKRLTEEDAIRAIRIYLNLFGSRSYDLAPREYISWADFSKDIFPPKAPR